jgi:hypothetical protein
MNIPRWLVTVWVVAIVVSTAAYSQFSPTSAQQAGEGFVISTVFLSATCVTALWLLWTRPGKRVYIILWTVALFVADSLSHFGPARPLPPGEKFYLSSAGPPITLAASGAVMLAVWAARKFHKPRAT